jgi:cell division protein ZapA
MAALGVTAELLATKSPEGPLSDMSMSEVKQSIAAMHETLDSALAPQEKLF